MNCLLLNHNKTSPELERWMFQQGGQWTTVSYDAYVNAIHSIPEEIRTKLEEISGKHPIGVFDRVVFVPPGLSIAVLPFFDELIQFCRDDVVPEQLNTIRGTGGTFIPCPETPIYRAAVA